MKFKKFWLGSAITLSLTAIGVAFTNPASFSNLLSRVRANTVSSGTITFDQSKSTKSGTTNTTVGTSQTGGTIICKTYDNDSTQSTGYVGAMKLGSSIKFYEADGVTEYTFEDLDKMTFFYTSRFGFYLHVTYIDGEVVRLGNPYGTNTCGSDGRTLSFTGSSFKDVSNIWVECASTGNYVAQMTKIVITYNCTTKYQTGVSIDTAPTKTSYIEGESFDPTGMIVKAQYSNGTSIATTSYTISPLRSLTISDTYITIYHNGFSTTQAITVSQNTLVGTYYYNNTLYGIEYTITLNSDGTGVYHVYSSSYDSYMHFTYTYSNGTITFTKDMKQTDSYVDSGYQNLFTQSGSYNDTNSATISNNTIKLYTCSLTARYTTVKNLAKQ